MSSETDRALSVLHETIAPPAGLGSIEKATGPDGKFQPDYWKTLSDILGWGSTATFGFQDAIQLSAVLICLDVLSQDIAKVTLRLMRRVKGGSEPVLPREHWLARLLADQPNEHHTWPEFIEMVMLQLGLVQNSFIVKRITPTGETTEMIPTIPGHVTIDVLEDFSAYVYRISVATMNELVQLRGFDVTLREEQVIHLRGRMFDGLYGYSTLAAGAKAMGLAKEISDFQSRLYQGDGALRGVFQMKDTVGEGELAEAAFKRLKQQLAERMTRFRREALPLILEGGLQFSGVSMTSDQAEVAKARDAAILDQCRLFRMPPHKAMHLAAVKYENLDSMERSYVSDTLIPYCKRIEHRLGRSLLNDDERLDLFLEFDRQEMMLADPEKLGKLLADGLKYGALEIDEWRRAVPIRLNPLPNRSGEVRVIPSTFTVVDRNNDVVIAAGGKDGQAESPDNSEGDQNPAKSADVVQLRSVS